MDDLMQWLREQIHHTLLQNGGRPDDAGSRCDLVNGLHFTYETVVDLCEAHIAILDRYEHERQRRDGELLRLEALDDAVRALGLAYQHRPGYREEWRP